MKNNTRRIYSEAEAEALRASYKWSAGVLQHEFDQETIDFSLMIVIVDAFMRCNILEEPPKQK